jgi:hypothetical protein
MFDVIFAQKVAEDAVWGTFAGQILIEAVSAWFSIIGTYKEPRGSAPG